jgi:hypothetical protein
VTSLAGAMLALPALAGCSATSGADTAALVELYTSEGCSSCPPADRWLATSFRPASGTARAIALAFHVDYWDRLGWRDRFASVQFTERQYDAMRANRGRFVYTPQVLIQGRDFPDWARGARTTAAIDAAQAEPPRAVVRLAARATREAVTVQARAEIASAADRDGTALFVALVDSGLVSQVAAGENRGERLTHDHVVRALHKGPAARAGGTAGVDLTLPWPAERGSAPSLVAFVQNTRTGNVLQAVALALSDPACATP